MYKVNHAGVELSLPSPSESLLKQRVKEESSAVIVDDIDDVKAYRYEVSLFFLLSDYYLSLNLVKPLKVPSVKL